MATPTTSQHQRIAHFLAACGRISPKRLIYLTDLLYVATVEPGSTPLRLPLDQDDIDTACDLAALLDGPAAAHVAGLLRQHQRYLDDLQQHRRDATEAYREMLEHADRAGHARHTALEGPLLLIELTDLQRGYLVDLLRRIDPDDHTTPSLHVGPGGCTRGQARDVHRQLVNKVQFPSPAATGAGQT